MRVDHVCVMFAYACTFARQRTQQVKDTMWLEPARYSARNVSSDLSFTFRTPFPLLTIVRASRTLLHVYVEVTNVRAFVFQLFGRSIYDHCPPLVSWNHEDPQAN